MAKKSVLRFRLGAEDKIARPRGSFSEGQFANIEVHFQGQIARDLRKELLTYLLKFPMAAPTVLDPRGEGVRQRVPGTGNRMGPPRAGRPEKWGVVAKPVGKNIHGVHRNRTSMLKEQKKITRDGGENPVKGVKGEASKI